MTLNYTELPPKSSIKKAIRKISKLEKQNSFDLYVKVVIVMTLKNRLLEQISPCQKDTNPWKKRSKSARHFASPA